MLDGRVRAVDLVPGAFGILVAYCPRFVST